MSLLPQKVPVRGDPKNLKNDIEEPKKTKQKKKKTKRRNISLLLG